MKAVVFYTEAASALLENVCAELESQGCGCFTTKITSDTTKTIQEQFLPFPDNVTHLVFVFPPSESDIVNISVFLFFAGYCFGRNLRAVALKVDENFPGPPQFESTATFVDIKDLASFFMEEAKRLADEEDVSSARAKILAKGIPLFAENFIEFAEKGDADVCKLFLQAGFDANMKDMRENPLLTVAVRGGSVDVVNVLLDGGADINAPSGDRGYSPLMDAVYTKNANIASLLLERGADPNTKGRDGATAICLAAGRGDESVCALLVEYNADPTIKDALGMSAAGYAKLFHNEALCSLFEV